jgi:hypothetical protein
MSVVKSRETHTNKRAVSGIMDPIPTGNLKPHNCKTPCPYGNGTTFCFPCMAKIMEEKRQKEKVSGKERLKQYTARINEASAENKKAERLAAYAGRLTNE